MTLSILIKLLLVLLYVPLVYVVTRVARYRLAIDHPFRQFLERHGVEKVARYTLFATYAIGGIVLTVLYS